MKGVAKALYNQPVVFLGALQAASTALSAAHVIPAWIPLLTLGVATAIQQRLSRPARRRR